LQRGIQAVEPGPTKHVATQIAQAGAYAPGVGENAARCAYAEGRLAHRRGVGGLHSDETASESIVINKDAIRGAEARVDRSSVVAAEIRAIVGDAIQVVVAAQILGNAVDVFGIPRLPRAAAVDFQRMSGVGLVEAGQLPSTNDLPQHALL